MTHQTHAFNKNGRLYRLKHTTTSQRPDASNDDFFYTHRDTGTGLNSWGSPFDKLSTWDVRDIFSSRRTSTRRGAE